MLNAWLIDLLISGPVETLTDKEPAMPTGALQRDRSPGYPIIALGEALGRLVEFDAHFKRSGAPPARAGDAWRIKAKAYTDRIVAALRYFGLMEYQGHGDERLVV